VSREPATLVILAGGESKRMGFPKHELSVGDVDILTHLHRRLGDSFVETVVVGRDLDRVPQGIRVTEDRFIARSPLVGIHAGLRVSRTELCFVIGCDMPHIEPDLVEHVLRRASGFDVAVPVVRGYDEPLLAAYRTTCIAAVEGLIGQLRLKVSGLFEMVRTNRIPEIEVRRHDAGLRSVENINLAAEAERVRTRAVTRRRCPPDRSR
jgi:molybdopterin-guanine dinucleotide biosynthesis protein A